MRARVWALSALAFCLACGAPSQTPPSPAAAADVQAAGSVVPTDSLANVTGAALAPVAIDPDWPTYQHDLVRSGGAAGDYNAASARQVWESDPLDGQVYAQVLVAGDQAIVVTQNNTVYALDVATGHSLWMQHLGDPVPRSTLPCGNVDPTGILSTPVVDQTAGVVYAVDYLQPQPQHELVALDLNTGAVRYHNRIDPVGVDPRPAQQRAPLSVQQGNVYVPFGGLFGDCGDYHGWVVMAGAADGHQRAAYQVPTHREGAIWGAPAFDAAGDLFVATGNSDGTGIFDQSNSVVRLSADLKLLDFFAPKDWADLNRTDKDLGSTGPVLLDSGQLLQIGKSGVGYLLNSQGLGKVGGEVFQAPICPSGAYGGLAHSGSMVYAACQDGVYAIQVQNGGFSVVWQGPKFNAGAPILTDDAVWTIDDATASLYALNRKDGSVLFRAPAGQGTNPPHFLSPSAAGGRVFHSRGSTVVAYSAG